MNYHAWCVSRLYAIALIGVLSCSDTQNLSVTSSATSTETIVFDQPRHDNFPIDATTWDFPPNVPEMPYNQKAADLFCKSNGYGPAVGFDVSKATQPVGTWRYESDGTGRFCDFCAWYFNSITCSPAYRLPFAGGMPDPSCKFSSSCYLITNAPDCPHNPPGSIDYGLPPGTEVLAAADGEVIFAGLSTGNCYGNMVLLQHADGRRTRYAHLQSISIANSSPKQGQRIGISGNSTGGPTCYAECKAAKKKLKKACKSEDPASDQSKACKDAAKEEAQACTNPSQPYPYHLHFEITQEGSSDPDGTIVRTLPGTTWYAADASGTLCQGSGQFDGEAVGPAP